MEFGRLHLNLKTLFLTMMMFKWGILCNATSDRCLSAPCRNAATCVDNMDDYVCICPRDGVRYMGKDCDQLYDACFFSPCDDCTGTPGTTQYHCVCPDGLTGDNCTENIDECESNPCSEPRSVCVDQLNGYFCRCPAGYGGGHCQTHVTDCIDAPCQNRGACVLLPEGFECQCAAGFEGRHCEDDVNECASQPCQNGAICVDGVAEFHCFCVPGFQGYNCEVDINECASRPCENNATCINEMDRYECECLGGFAGVNCENEIDECESNPCQNEATCHDLVAMYSCECRPGFDGTDCEVDVDECASEPCQNGATCHDLVNSYACDCMETGFMGDHCEEDILECASDPCQHGATCLEGVKEYNCLCWPGYEGPHCEIDIDECAVQPCQNGGECYQRSDPTHWEVGWELDHADAAGYICQCQPGFAGENCSVNIDECESEPCQNGGICEDQINGYACICAAGFAGDICEINIDECESQPCLNGGWCVDGVASYVCHCPNVEPAGKLPWGGDRCHVKLYGCVDHQCQNGATCLPWLRNDEHGHTCLCPHGFYDDRCSTQTTFSFSTAGFVHIEVIAREDRRRRGAEQQPRHLTGYSGVRLRFRTTLPNMLLFYRGDAASYLSLEIVKNGLRAKALFEGSEMDVHYQDSVNDGDWWDAHAFVTEDSLVLVLKGSNCDPQGCKLVDGDHNGLQLNPESFAHVYVGGAPGDLLERTASGKGFLGCMEDLEIDSKPILPQDLPEDPSHELGCSKTEWCESDPCSGNGQCVDLWTNYRCDCHRPYRSQSCSEEFQSWTYSHEDTVSYSAYDVRSSHRGKFSVSFFIRSLKPDGLLFQLRRPTGDDEGQAYFSVYLGMGRVFVSSLPNSAPLTAPIFLANGEKQFLQVEVQHRQVIFEHAGLRYGIGEIPEVEVNSGDVAYVGGLPQHWSSEAWGGPFKGCLQDMRLDTVHLVLEAWRGSEEESLCLARDAEHVEIGCVSDDACRVEPCENKGSCAITFNDFTCSCPKHYTGKTCETRVWCVSGPCVNGGHCVDLSDGYECVYNATFENSPVRYRASGTVSDPVTSIYMELRTRSQNAVLLRAARGSDLLTVGLLDSSIHVEIRTGNGVETMAFSGIRLVADGSWHRVTVVMAEREKEPLSHWTITVDGITDASSAPHRSGSIRFLADEEAAVSIGERFTGCLGAVRIGGVYLPFVDDRKAPQSAQFHLVGDPKITVGCKGAPVCASDPCRNGARCEDLFNKFGCVCNAGWTGDRCHVDIDDCASGPCGHGTCRDYLGGYECRCHPGYAGDHCGEDLNECDHHACEHGGTCKDGPNMYTCICPKDYAGPLCQWAHPPAQCGRDLQCSNEGFCNDGLWGANCTCIPGYAGVRCETEVDECESNPCRNGGSCLDRLNRFLCVCPPGYSGPVCDTNKQAQKDRVPWLMLAIPLVCFCVLILIVGLTFMVLTARKKRQSEGAYSPSTQELAGARLEMDSMLKVPPEERLI
ncbi:unnamed protein product [Merluccius merluccius]